MTPKTVLTTGYSAGGIGSALAEAFKKAWNTHTAKSMYEMNVWGMFRVTQAFAPLVIAAKGTIINISSISPCVHTPWMGVYTGSKAAVTAITDTLRLELAPFGVKVVTVVTGAVNTNTLSNGEIAARARGEDGTPPMEPSVYAEKVVADILQGANWQIWRGGYASIVRFTSNWFPASISDLMSARGTGLDVITI
ncbi:hypothetical protein JMJ35_003562 [Cladonia borealis]|uniref:Uncharacterized protein n=1 Tax=Cladonia borealis TaxID=184061 RepID=A0AA39V8X4_9LECA|nr:hypothetical protein JMJ35_003562 [Cladonia borealis]